MYWRNKIYVLIFVLIIASQYIAQASDRSFKENFEIQFFVISQNSLSEIDSPKEGFSIPDVDNKQYYQAVFTAISALKKRDYALFDSLVFSIKNYLPVGISYDTIGYYHYLQYRQKYIHGNHREAMEQLIYAKESFKRNNMAIMTLESLVHYFGNYTNSIFSTMKVEDLSVIENEISAFANTLNEQDETEYWAKILIFDKMGVLLGLDNQLEKSEKYFVEIIDKTKDRDNKRMYYNTIGNLSINQYKKGDHQKSIENAMVDLKSSLETGANFSSAGLGVLLAKNYLALGQADQSLKYLNMADSFSVKLNGIFQVDILETKAEYYQTIGETERSNEFLQQYLNAKDSINLNAIREMEFRLKTEQDYYQKMKKYEAENLRNLATIRTQRFKNTITTIILVFMLFLSLIIGFMLSNIRKKNKLLYQQQDEILQANEELSAKNETITELNKNLENKVAERTSDLEEKTKIIEAFLYQMSHRFRSPIANLKGLVNLIEIEKNQKTIPHYLDLSKSSINKLDNLLVHIKQLLEFDKTEKDSHLFNISELTEEVIGEVKVKYPEVTINNSKQLKVDKPIKTRAVRDYHKVVIKEILDNACKFSKLDGNNNPSVSLEQLNSPDFYQIIIHDTGPGIDKEHWDHVFEPFYVGNELSKGDGLGIYVASIAANKTGCKIELDHENMKGTRMIISIPIHP